MRRLGSLNGGQSQLMGASAAPRLLRIDELNLPTVARGSGACEAAAVARGGIARHATIMAEVRCMDETKTEGEPLPRYRLFESDAKHQPIGDAVCQSDNLDDLRVFRRRADTRYVLYDRRNRVDVSNLDVDAFTEFKSDKADGHGWYCKNPKCSMLIATAVTLSPGDETLVHITCPRCHHPGYYFFRDYGWKKWRVR
jgi:hypothetical protein